MAIRMGAVNNLDASGVHGLEEIIDELESRGGELVLLEPKMEVLHVLDSAGLLERIGARNIIHQRTREAIVEIIPRLDDRTCLDCEIRAFGTVCERHRNALLKQSNQKRLWE